MIGLDVLGPAHEQALPGLQRGADRVDADHVFPEPQARRDTKAADGPPDHGIGEPHVEHARAGVREHERDRAAVQVAPHALQDRDGRPRQVELRLHLGQAANGWRGGSHGMAGPIANDVEPPGRAVTEYVWGLHIQHYISCL
jgi:hypothetical protein